MKRELSVVAIVFLAAAGLGRITAEAADDNKALHNQESAFLRQRAQSDVFEWRLGDYAQAHGATERGKEIGKQMSADHQADLREVQQLATEHDLKLEVPKGLTPQQQATYDSLVAKKGIDFDKAYTKLLVSEHNEDLAQAQRERDHAQDASVREYAGKLATTLEHHLKMSKDAEAEVWKQ